jgi:hypothetical protein
VKFLANIEGPVQGNLSTFPKILRRGIDVEGAIVDGGILGSAGNNDKVPQIQPDGRPYDQSR